MLTARSLLSAAIFLLGYCSLDAHYHLLLASSASGETEKPIRLTWSFGHPFEHEFSDVQKPRKLIVVAPDGTSTDLLNQVQAEKKGKITSYTINFTPLRRGDYVFWAESAPVTMESEKVIYQDTVKLIYHVLQAQRGWDHFVGSGLELVPLTRPYGLEPGLVFPAQALLAGKPQFGAMVEVERYNPDPPKHEELPLDEQITRQMKTDPNGIVTCTLPDPGWWVITITLDGGTERRDGRDFKIKKRSTLLVFVEKKPKESK